MMKQPWRTLSVKQKKTQPEIGKYLHTFNKDFGITIFRDDEFSLGKGMFGKCYLGMKKDDSKGSGQSFFDQNKLIVIKQMVKDSSLRDIAALEEQYRNELNNLSKVTAARNAINLVQVYPYQIISQNHFYIVMEYCQHNSLKRYLEIRKKPLSFHEYCQIFLDCMAGYESLRCCEIIHEDLKPDNILIKDKIFKLADFGLSINLRAKKKRGRGGSRNYNGPEKYSQLTQPCYRSDIFAFGVIFFELFYGCHPYYNENKYYKFKIVREGIIRNQDKDNKFSKQNLNYKNNMRKLQNQLYLQFLNQTNIQERPPQIQCPLKQEKVFEQMQSLIKKMCDKDQKMRPSFETIQKLKEQWRLKSNFKRQDLFTDLIEPKIINMDFSQSDLLIEGSSVIDHETLLGIKSVRLMQKKKSHGKIEILRKDMFESNLQIRLISQVSEQFRGDFKDQLQQWQTAVFTELLNEYLFMINRKALLHVQQTLKNLDQNEIKQYYQQNLDNLCKIFQKNQQFLEEETFNAVYDVKKIKELQKSIYESLSNHFNSFQLSFGNYCDAYLRLLLYKMLKQFEDQNSHIETLEQIQSEYRKIISEQITISQVSKALLAEKFSFILQPS